MTRTFTKAWRLAATSVAALPAFWACATSASGLQVEPVNVTITDRSEAIWLSNTGGEQIDAQVRVYQWTQDADGDHLEPTSALIASPPIIKIEPGGRQLVRLVPLAVNASATPPCEATFRLAVDEIPPARKPGSGLLYVLHYSLPVFIPQPACRKSRPDMHLSLQVTEAGAVQLAAENSGAVHAQLAHVVLRDAKGRSSELMPGLLGYVLAGERRTFAIPGTLSGANAAFASGGRIEALINGSPFSQTLPPSAPVG